jgi:hypothetical protein
VALTAGRDEDGNKFKVTTTTRVRKLARARLSKAAVERHNWAKFGDAASTLLPLVESFSPSAPRYRASFPSPRPF